MAEPTNTDIMRALTVVQTDVRLLSERVSTLERTQRAEQKTVERLELMRDSLRDVTACNTNIVARLAKMEDNQIEILQMIAKQSEDDREDLTSLRRDFRGGLIDLQKTVANLRCSNPDCNLNGKNGKNGKKRNDG